MFGFLGFLLILFLLVVFIGLAILGNILRVLFGFGGKRNMNTQNRSYTRRGQDFQDSTSTEKEDSAGSYSSSSSSRKKQKANGEKKKIFGEDEGEYVDFEEEK